MATLQIQLSDDLEVERLAKEAGYADAGAYVEALVRADRRRRAEERLEALSLEGLESGPPVPATEEYWEEFRRDVDRRLAKSDRTASPE